MGSLLEEPARREAAARDRVEAIREQIDQLRERLAAGEQVLPRLVITRETIGKVLSETTPPAERPRAGRIVAAVGLPAGAAKVDSSAVRFGGANLRCSPRPGVSCYTPGNRPPLWRGPLTITGVAFDPPTDAGLRFRRSASSDMGMYSGLLLPPKENLLLIRDICACRWGSKLIQR